MAIRPLSLFRNTEGAVAPTVALSLFALIASGGLAFDYARLAAMDTELQQAADHAALAAATQLDRLEGAQDRASASIQAADNADTLAANFTRFANDEGDLRVEISTLMFCSEFDDSVEDTVTACTEADGDSDSLFVVVTTQTRIANYALTPVVAAFASEPVRAVAVAGVESAICNVAPLLVCAPSDDFPDDDDIGKGIRLKPAAGPDSWAPGNWGLLDFGNGNPAVMDAMMGHGLNGCQATDDNSTEPGVKEVTDAMNTRLDVYDTNNTKVWNNATKAPRCDGGSSTATGSGCPAENTRKDGVLTLTYEVTTATTVTTAPGIPACGATGTGITYGNQFAWDAAAKGFPRDTCHDATCGNIGDGVWDFAGYMAANHPGVDTSAVGGDTRYATYVWELANPTTAMDPQQVGATVSSFKDKGSNREWTVKKQCTFSKPKVASSEYAAQKDRRLLPIVSANCDDLKGKGGAGGESTGYKLLRVFDVFITEPSFDRPALGITNKEIYAEIVGPAETGEGTSGFQYYSKNRPYLIR